MRWKITAHDEGGRVKLVLTNGADSVPVGMATMSWLAYRGLATALFQFVLNQAVESITKSLGDKLWTDAQRIWHDSPDLAMQKLAEFGWNQVKVEEYSRELAMHLVDRLTGFLPEHKR
jgi:hypothetical protein